MIIRNVYTIRLVKEGISSKVYMYAGVYQRRIAKIDSISNLIKRNIV